MQSTVEFADTSLSTAVRYNETDKTCTIVKDIKVGLEMVNFHLPFKSPTYIHTYLHIYNPLEPIIAEGAKIKIRQFNFKLTFNDLVFKGLFISMVTIVRFGDLWVNKFSVNFLWQL